MEIKIGQVWKHPYGYILKASNHFNLAIAEEGLTKINPYFIKPESANSAIENF